MLRLVAYAPNGVRRYPIGSGELVIGSADDCDICLPFSGVAKRHARIRRSRAGVELEDLGSRRMTLLNGERIRQASLRVLDEVRLGKVTLLLEDVAPVSKEPSSTPRTTKRAAPDPSRLLDQIASISDWVIVDTESRQTIESLVSELIEDFGGGACFLFQGEPGDQLGTKFAAVTETAFLESAEQLQQSVCAELGDGKECVADVVWRERTTWVFSRRFSVLDRSYLMIFAFPHFKPADWSPEIGLGVVADLLVLGLVHHVGRFEPILPGHGGQAELTLAEGFVVGSAARSQRLLADLRPVASSTANVLLMGEPGSGRELVARSLHLSGQRGDGPFVTASCDGAAGRQLSADLFGAEIAGKGAPVRRESRLLSANGGTLFLDEVEKMPLELQGRLVRVLRSGRLDGPGQSESHAVDLRVMAATLAGLDSLVAEGAFRVDLAYHLSECTVQVPGLRERMEDVPLLIQTLINRYSHETGHRVRGITVQALQALSRYHFPGNLRELENIVRQMVFRANSGEPMGVDLLPREVRNPRAVPVQRMDSGSDLDLARLVASCEVDAIREALRRTEGNKSQAAKLLGLSRNGLAKKMNRLELGN